MSSFDLSETFIMENLDRIRVRDFSYGHGFIYNANLNHYVKIKKSIIDAHGEKITINSVRYMRFDLNYNLNTDIQRDHNNIPVFYR